MKALWLRLLGIGKSLWEFLLPIIASATSSYLEQMLPVAATIVGNLATSALSGEDKRKEAFSQLQAEAISRGINVSVSTLNLAIEMAVAKLKEGK